MATMLAKYETVKLWLGAQIAATTGYDNVDVHYGDPTAKLDVPSARISQASPLETTREGYQLLATGAINVGITALYVDETTFLEGLEPFVQNLNDNGSSACGIETLFVSAIEFSSEDEKYARATITVYFESYV